MVDESSSPIDSFVSQFFRDEQEGKLRPLGEYLGMFPGADLEIAREYISLTEGERAPRSADQIGHYHLLRELGRGGQAIVHLAEDTRIRDRKVAVKVLTDPSLLSEVALQRFRREAEVASRLEHPGICPVHEAAVQELRHRAAPYDAAQQEADAEKRREIHAGLFDSLAAKEKEITSAEEEVVQVLARIAAIETEIAPADNERVIGQYEKRKKRSQVALKELRSSILALRDAVVALEQDPRLCERLTWEYADPTDRWRHQVLSQMVQELRGLRTLIQDVEKRQSFAETIEQRSIVDHRTAWDRCFADLRTNPKYAASAELEDMKPQVGLVPLGIDRESGLWEFWHLGSGGRPGWKGEDRPGQTSGNPRLRVQISEASGIVLVLLPGGTFSMGATRQLGGQNYDPEADLDERPVREVTLDPFFMSKYELTQGQWERLMSQNPSQFCAGNTDYLGGTVTLLHPVTNVDWGECQEAMLRWDLELPTEARWEYACRAGTSTVYWSGDSVVSIQDQRAGNIADKTASNVSSGWAYSTEVDDGYVVHAPVGSFAANAFGLHDLLGNVWEWCRDRYSSYAQPPRHADGLRDEAGSRDRVLRGGSFEDPAPTPRSANRNNIDPSARVLGCRPARRIGP